MSQPVQQNETVIIKKSLIFYLVSSVDGKTPYTGAGGGQPCISVNGENLNATGIGTLTHIGNGMYYAPILATEMGDGGVAVGFYGASPGTVDPNCYSTPSLQVLQLIETDPYVAIPQPSDIWSYQNRTLTSLGSGAIQGIWNYAIAGISAGIGAQIVANLDTNVGSRSDFDNSSDTVILDATGFENISISEYAGRATSLSQMVIGLYMRFFNEVDQSSTTQTIKQTGGATAVSGSVSNVAGVQTKGALS